VVRSGLLEWYDQHRRQLPWRGDHLDGRPRIEPSGYGTWISEVMLQQTRVDTVIAYWFTWLVCT
jgi:A/G-specific adenine glycosylase